MLRPVRAGIMVRIRVWDKVVISNKVRGGFN